MCLPDELIREITVNCAERGLLLLRVRDELRMTVAAYQVRCSRGAIDGILMVAVLPSDRLSCPVQGLYEANIAYGMRQSMRSEQLKADLNKQTKEAEMRKVDLTRRSEELNQFCRDQAAT